MKQGRYPPDGNVRPSLYVNLHGHASKGQSNNLYYIRSLNRFLFRQTVFHTQGKTSHCVYITLLRTLSVYTPPITAAARSKAWTGFAPSNAGIVGSNPTQGIDICVRLFCLCVGSGFATGWSPVQGVLPTVYIKKPKKRPRSNKRTVDRQTDRQKRLCPREHETALAVRRFGLWNFAHTNFYNDKQTLSAWLVIRIPLPNKTGNKGTKRRPVNSPCTLHDSADFLCLLSLFWRKYAYDISPCCLSVYPFHPP
jgi:hypothetical protein